MEERVGPLTFISNFDSGNLARVEKAKLEENISCAEDDSPVVIVPDYDYNVWTAPDCAGMECENSNRTWFYFGVRGGQPGKLLRITIMNLNRQGKLYSQGMAPLVKAVPSRNKWERIREKPKYETLDGQFTLSFLYRFPDQRNGVCYFAFCYPYSYSECQAKLKELDKTFPACKQMTQTTTSSSIYYCRELLCHSLDGLRIDLLTVSSVNGMMEEREDYLPNLFPDRSVPRVHRFSGKKVFFLSARVHPGETPSSFVFNGFLDFILRKDDPRAAALRNQYVFKMIPMLNPDGVKRGHYRTDTRGVNLNRVYINPDPFLHPSVFAARSVILHHHHKGMGLHEGSKIAAGCTCDATRKADTVEASDENSDDSATCMNNHNLDTEAQICSNATENTAVNIEPIPAEFKYGSPVFKSLHEELMHSVVSNMASDQDGNNNECHSKVDKVCHAVELFSFEEKVLPSLAVQDNHQIVHNPKMDNQTGRKLPNESSATGECTEQALKSHLSMSKQLSRKIPGQNKKGLQECSCYAKMSAASNSGVEFYVDLHGHASKRGCFVYANFLENEDNYVNTILFPKLVSLNSANFEFAACNFTEKNMYSKDKQDGMSKEGSGRVAIYKATGILHCYTLECNYNCGRMVNPLPPATCDNGHATPPPPPGFPPKYTPEIYEEIGRALAVAVLDIHNSNPWSRLPLSEFTSLEGVRNWVKRFVRSSKNAPSVPKKLSRIITKTSSMVAGATAMTRQKVSVLARSSSDVSSNNTAVGYHTRATDFHQQYKGKKTAEDSKQIQHPAPTSTRKSSLQGTSSVVKSQESCFILSGAGSHYNGASQDPGLGCSPATAHVNRPKEASRVSLELPKTGPTLRLMHTQRNQNQLKHVSPSGKTLSSPSEIKMSTIDVHKQFIGFHRSKVDPVRSGHISQSDEETKKKTLRPTRKQKAKKKEKLGELRLQHPVPLPRPCAEELADMASPQKDDEEKTKGPQLAKRNSSKNLINCTMMSCELVDIKELPNSPQGNNNSNTSVAFWTNASVT